MPDVWVYQRVVYPGSARDPGDWHVYLGRREWDGKNVMACGTVATSLTDDDGVLYQEVQMPIEGTFCGACFTLPGVPPARRAADGPVAPGALRRFLLVRDEDVSGISGIGTIGEGIAFSTGKAVLGWVTAKRSVAIYDSIDELDAIHGHDGKTRIQWLD